MPQTDTRLLDKLETKWMPTSIDKSAGVKEEPRAEIKSSLCQYGSNTYILAEKRKVSPSTKMTLKEGTNFHTFSICIHLQI